MTDRIIGEVTGATGYGGLIAVLRSWVCQLDTSYESIDELAGWEGRYTSKVLGPSHIKAIGRKTMGKLLGALGLKLIVAADEAALARIKQRLVPNRWPPGRRATQRHKVMEAAAAVEQDADAQRRALMSELGRQSHAARMARTTPEARQQQASKAASARWKAARRRLREAAAEARA
jgi:hypothetical protein